MFFFVIGRTEDRGAEEDADVDSDHDLTLCNSSPGPYIVLHFHRLVARFRMSAPVRVYVDVSSANSVVMLYTALTEDLFNEMQFPLNFSRSAR